MAMIAAAFPALNSPPGSTGNGLRADLASQKPSEPAFEEILQNHRDQTNRETADGGESINARDRNAQPIGQIDESAAVETGSLANEVVANESTPEADLQTDAAPDDASTVQEYESQSVSHGNVENRLPQQSQFPVHLSPTGAQHQAIERRPVQVQLAHTGEFDGFLGPQESPRASMSPTTQTTAPTTSGPLPSKGEVAIGPKTQSNRTDFSTQAAPVTVRPHSNDKTPDDGGATSPLPSTGSLPLNHKPVIDTQSLPLAGAGKVPNSAESVATTNLKTETAADEQFHNSSSKNAPAARGSGGDGGSVGGGGEPTPALARAAHVELGIRLENATGQAPGADASLRSAVAPQPLHPSAQSNPTTLQTAASQHTQSNIFPGHVADQSAPETPFANQVVRGLSAMLNQRGGVMNMRLDPPELGALRVQMTIARGVVSAEFQSANPQAQGLLEKSMATLRTALESQGLTVDRLSVHVAHVASGNSGAQFQRDDGNSSGQPSLSRQSHDAGGHESRGRGEHQHEAPARHYRAAKFNDLFHEFESLTSQ